MNMKKSVNVSLMIALAGGSVLAGCSSNKEKTPSAAPPSASPGASSNASAAPAATPNTAKKLTISSIRGSWADPIPDTNGEGVKKINEKFNVELKPQFVPYDEYANKLPVVMAAGDLPDMIGSEAVDANFVKWAKQGAFLPLNDYIDKYPQLKAIPKYVWDAVTVDGKIYGIPNYFPAKYGKKPIIRKDWLDNLNLKMPTNYDELKQVAIAFTKNDPDKNGKNDTIGLALASKIVYGAPMGTAWDSSWYYKNAAGQLIPGTISDGFKQQISFMRDLYQEGAISKDWAVSKIGDVRKDFFAGKYGIFYEQPYDISETRFKTLKQLQPGAELAVIPAFKQPDGQQGFTGLPGFYEVTMLNGKLKSDPDKVNRILQMLDYFFKFIPVDQRNPQNADYDWQNGGVDKAYTMTNGVAIDKEGANSLQPKSYIIDRYWAPSDEATDPAKVLQDPFTKNFVQSAVDLLKNTKFYLDPVNRIHSEVLDAKGSELDKLVNDHQTKMIVGQESMADWDKMVQEYLSKGGKEIIDDVNKKLADAKIAGEWK